MHLLKEILELAQHHHAHDIHVLPPRSSLEAMCLFRQGRLLVHQHPLGFAAWSQLLEFVKFHGHYDYSQHTQFQHLQLQYKTHTIRLACAPGPRPYMTWRLHHPMPQELPSTLQPYLEQWLLKPSLLLIVGPMKSGKTTLYYQLLQALHQHKRTVLSLEDPIEQENNKIMQVALTHRNLHELILDALRFDMDVVGVGELRRLGDLSALCFLTLSHLHTVSTLHAGSLQDLQQKFQMLPRKDYEQLQHCVFGALLLQDLSLPWTFLSHDDLFTMGVHSCAPTDNALLSL